jgi:hypothetical protein
MDVRIRPAKPAGSPAVALLSGELGYPTTADDVEQRPRGIPIVELPGARFRVIFGCNPAGLAPASIAARAVS